MSPDERSPDALLLNTKDHYEHLISYHQWIVKTTLVALGIIVSVAGFFSYKSLSDVENKAKANLENAEHLAEQQILNVRTDADKIAREEAQSRVDSAFRSENVQALVESAAKREVGSAIQRQVASEVGRAMEPLQEEITTWDKSLIMEWK